MKISHYIPYTAKLPQGKTIAFFVVSLNHKSLFLQIMALTIGNISLQKYYSKTFTVNSLSPLLNMKVSSCNFCRIQ